jgi:hypothetical protein
VLLLGRLPSLGRAFLKLVRASRIVPAPLRALWVLVAAYAVPECQKSAMLFLFWRLNYDDDTWTGTRPAELEPGADTAMVSAVTSRSPATRSD